MRQPGVIEAISQSDASVCRNGNHTAWTKLRGLLILRYHVLARGAAVHGSARTAAMVQHSADQVRRRLPPQAWR